MRVGFLHPARGGSIAAGAAKPEDGGGDFVGTAEAADGLVGDGFGDAELAFGDHVGDHRRLDCAWADRVDPDPAGRVLQGGTSGEADDAVLGCVVCGPARQPDESAEG